MSEFFRDTVLDVFVSFNLPHIFNDNILKNNFRFIGNGKYYEKASTLIEERKFNLGNIQDVGPIKIAHSEHWRQIWKAFCKESKDISEDIKTYLPPLVPLKVTSKHIIRTYIVNEELRIPVNGRLQIFLYPIGAGIIRVRFPIISQTSAKDIIRFMDAICNNEINVLYKGEESKFINFLVTIKKNILKSLFDNKEWRNIYFKLSDFKFALHLGGVDPISLKSSKNRAMIAGFLRIEQEYQNLSKEMINVITKYRLLPFLKGDIFYFSKRVALAYTPILFSNNKYHRSRKRFRKRFFLGVELAHMVDYNLTNINDITEYIIANSFEKLPVLINTLAISLNPHLLGCIHIENAPGLITPYSVEKFFIEQGKAIGIYEKYEMIVINFRELIKDLIAGELLKYIDDISMYTSDEFAYAFENVCRKINAEQPEQDTIIYDYSNHSKGIIVQADWMKVLNYLANAYVYDRILEEKGIPNDYGWRTISAISNKTKINRDKFYKHKIKGRRGIISSLQEEQLIIVDRREGPKYKRKIIHVRINPDHKISKYLINMIMKQKKHGKRNSKK